MVEASKMVCHNCGAEMNRHAEKLDVLAVLAEPDAVDPDLGGILEEIYACPKCGKTAIRRAT